MAMVAQIRLAAASAPVALFPWLAPQATSTFKLIHPATARQSIHSPVRPVCARFRAIARYALAVLTSASCVSIRSPVHAPRRRRWPPAQIWKLASYVR
jgi:hypothetical protein